MINCNSIAVHDRNLKETLYFYKSYNEQELYFTYIENGYLVMADDKEYEFNHDCVGAFVYRIVE